MSEDQQINRRLTRLEDQVDVILNRLPGEKKERSSAVKQAQDIAALVGAVLAAVAGSAFIFYAFGYMIVNTYLASYGVRVSELTNPAYIPAGLSFVLIGLLLPASVIVVIWKAMISGKRRSAKGELAFSLVIALLVGFLVGWLTNIVLSIASGKSNNPPSFVSTYALFAGFTSAIYVFTVYLIFSRERTGKFNEFLSVFLAAIFMLTALLYWSNTVYSHLAPGMGGGQTVEVRFSVSDPNDEQIFRAIGIGVDNQLHLTDPVYFLVDTNDGFLVLLKDGSAARIDKKLITNFRYTSPITTSASVTLTLPFSSTPTIQTSSSITPTP